MTMTETASTTQISSPWLRKSEAADYAGITTRTLDKWRHDGLPYSVVRGTVLFHRDDIDTYIRSHAARTIARRHRMPA